MQKENQIKKDTFLTVLKILININKSNITLYLKFAGLQKI